MQTNYKVTEIFQYPNFLDTPKKTIGGTKLTDCKF